MPLDRSLAHGLVFVLMTLASLHATAITLGQSDGFQGGTAGWASGAVNPAQPTVVSGGGPAGAADAYLSITSLGGAGPGSRLVVINSDSWSGDYVAAGVSGINLDAANFGATDLFLRLAFFGTGYVTEGFSLPAGSGWRTLQFSFDPAATAGMTDLRLFHGQSASSVFPGPAVAALLGIDNVTAVPEPGGHWLLAGGLAALGLWRRRRAS